MFVVVKKCGKLCYLWYMDIVKSVLTPLTFTVTDFWQVNSIKRKRFTQPNNPLPVEGTVAWFFLFKMISPKVHNWSSDSWSKAVLNKDSNLPRNSTSKVFPRYGPLRRILSCAMGHCGQFDCSLGPLGRIWLYTMGHCSVFGYALWATVRYEAVQ